MQDFIQSAKEDLEKIVNDERFDEYEKEDQEKMLTARNIFRQIKLK